MNIKKRNITIPLILIAACSNTPEPELKAQSYNGTFNNLLNLEVHTKGKTTKDFWTLSQSSAPEYPLLKLSKYKKGCVKFSFIIDSEGAPKNIKIVRAVPKHIFNKSALKAIKTYRWTATQENADSQPLLTTLSIHFSKKKNTYSNRLCDENI